MSEELLPCPFCGGKATHTPVVNHPAVYIVCLECFSSSAICPTLETAIKAWNTRPDSKPYKYATEDELQEAKGWYTSEFQEAITFAFNAGRERNK